MSRDGQYRLLWTNIFSSKKVRAVKGKKVSGEKWWRIACHLVYSWLVSAQDDDGRLRGRPGWVLENILPYEELTFQEITEILTELDRVGLIQWYEVDEDKFIQIIQGPEHQNIRKDRYKSSIYPELPILTTTCPSNCQPDGCQNVNPYPSPSPSLSPSLSKDMSVPDKSKRNPLSVETFISEIKKNPAYSHINLEIEINKMKAWLLTPKGRGRKLSSQFILNWINKIEKPLEVFDGTETPPTDKIDRRIWESDQFRKRKAQDRDNRGSGSPPENP